MQPHWIGRGTVFGILVGILFVWIVSLALGLIRKTYNLEDEDRAHNEWFIYASLSWVVFAVSVFALAEFLGIEKVGQFGDAFNVLNALFAGLAFAGIIITLRFQQKQIKDSDDAQKVATKLGALTALIQASDTYLAANRAEMEKLAGGIKSTLKGELARRIDEIDQNPLRTHLPSVNDPGMQPIVRRAERGHGSHLVLLKERHGNIQRMQQTIETWRTGDMRQVYEFYVGLSEVEIDLLPEFVSLVEGERTAITRFCSEQRDRGEYLASLKTMMSKADEPDGK